MKKVLKIIGYVFLGLIVLWILYITYDNRVGKRNMENSQKITIGMSENEVIAVMGKPDNIITETKSGEHHYTYSTNSDSFTHIQITFDSEIKKVEEIYIPIWQNN